MSSKKLKKVVKATKQKEMFKQWKKPPEDIQRKKSSVKKSWITE